MILILIFAATSTSGASSQPPQTTFCVDITQPARTSTTARVLSMSERAIYQLAERGAAVARGWKVEAEKCDRNLEIETNRADAAEMRLIDAPPVQPDGPRILTLPWLEIVGAGVGGMVGAYYGALARDEVSASIGAGIGAIAGASIGMLMHAIATEF